MKWRLLLAVPAYPMVKQTQIILACMALHNFIRDSALRDDEFDQCDNDENYIPGLGEASVPGVDGNTSIAQDEQDMNTFRDNIANSLMIARG